MTHIYKIEIVQRDQENYEARRTFELQVALSDNQFARLINDIVSTATNPDLLESDATSK
jgi:hypothetical protein